MLQSSNHSGGFGLDVEPTPLTRSLDVQKLAPQAPQVAGAAASSQPQAAYKASPKKRQAASKAAKQLPRPAAKQHVPLLVEDDSKPARFSDIGNFGLPCSVLFRPPGSSF
jgi:hypothetical protein